MTGFSILSSSQKTSCLKLIATVLPVLFFTAHSAGQHIEYSLHLNSGLFFYTGNAANTNSFLIDALPYNFLDAHANNVTGTRSGFSYDGSAGIQKITAKNVVFGLYFGAQSLQSKVHLVNGTDQGNAFLRSYFISYYPFAGYRFHIKSVEIDAVAGAEGAHLLSSTEKDVLTYPTSDSHNTLSRKDAHGQPGFVVRIRAMVNVWYRRWGIGTGCAYDLTDFYHDNHYGPLAAHGTYIRAGLSYRIHYQAVRKIE